MASLTRSSDLQQEAATQQRCGSLPVGEEAEVPDADEPLGQDVDAEGQPVALIIICRRFLPISVV
jgi:hypothetical protein